MRQSRPKILYDDEDFARLERIVRRQSWVIAARFMIDVIVSAAFAAVVV